MKKYKSIFEKRPLPYVKLYRQYIKGEIDYSSLQDELIRQNRKDGVLDKYLDKDTIRQLKEKRLIEMSIIRTIIDELVYHADVKDIHKGGEGWFENLVESCIAVYSASLIGYINSGSATPSFTKFIEDLSDGIGKKDYQKAVAMKREKDFWMLIDEIENFINK